MAEAGVIHDQAMRGLESSVPGLVNVYSLRAGKLLIKIADLPINSMVIFQFDI